MQPATDRKESFSDRYPLIGCFLLPLLRPVAVIKRLLLPWAVMTLVLLLILADLSIVPDDPRKAWEAIVVFLLLYVLALAAIVVSWQRLLATDTVPGEFPILLDGPVFILASVLLLQRAIPRAGLFFAGFYGLDPIAPWLALAWGGLASLALSFLAFGLPAIALGDPRPLALAIRTPWRVRFGTLAVLAMTLAGEIVLFGFFMAAGPSLTDAYQGVGLAAVILLGMMALSTFPLGGYTMLSFKARRAVELQEGRNRLLPVVDEEGDVLRLPPRDDRAITMIVLSIGIMAFFLIYGPTIVKALASIVAMAEGPLRDYLGINLPVGLFGEVGIIGLLVLAGIVLIHHVTVFIIQIIDKDSFEVDDTHFRWMGRYYRVELPLSSIQSVQLRRVGLSQTVLAITLKSTDAADLEGVMHESEEQPLHRRAVDAVYRLSIALLLALNSFRKLRRNFKHVFRGTEIDLDHSKEALFLKRLFEVNYELAAAHIVFPSNFSGTTTRSFAKSLRDRVAAAGG